MPALPSEAKTPPSVRTLQDAAALGVLVLVGELTRLLALPVHRVLQISPAGPAGRRWRSRCWPPQTPRLPSRAAASPACRKQVRFLAAGSWRFPVFGSLAWWIGASCRVIDAERQLMGEGCAQAEVCRNIAHALHGADGEAGGIALRLRGGVLRVDGGRAAVSRHICVVCRFTLAHLTCRWCDNKHSVGLTCQLACFLVVSERKCHAAGKAHAWLCRI